MIGMIQTLAFVVGGLIGYALAFMVHRRKRDDKGRFTK